VTETTRIATGIQDVDPRHALDVPRLEAYVAAQLDEFGGGLRVRQFVGGQSNPTYHLTDGRGEWVLRRKPPGQLVSSAHAVDREFRVLEALHGVDFPVPRPRAYCDDETVIGTEFYLMDKIDGRILIDQTLPGWSADDRRSLYASQIEILARLHRLDPTEIGLGDYGKSGNYFARQIHVWSKQYRTADVPESDSMESLMEWLPGHIPADDQTTLVHGDYGLNNLVLHPTEARIVAVLDWELSTLGHPLADLTYHLSGRLSPKGHFSALSEAELVERGIPTQSEYVARYCELTGRDGIEHLDFYLAFHLFRTAGIMFGIAGRAKAGTAAGSEARELGKLALPLADRALELARRLGA
jgi:aminoglycoside phosphotransferase (APT) family kinase protein